MTSKVCWFGDGSKGHLVGFEADSKSTLERPKDTLPIGGKGIAKTLASMQGFIQDFELGGGGGGGNRMVAG